MTVTFHDNVPGSNLQVEQTDNVAASLQAFSTMGFSYSNYFFAGWNTEPGGGGTSFPDQGTYSFASDINLYAQWIQVTHSVLFYSNLTPSDNTNYVQTGNSPAPLSLESSFAIVNPNHTFEGWNTQRNGSGTSYADGSTYSFAADLSLYAQWNGETESLLFSPNGGLGSVPSLSAAFGSTVTLPLANSMTRSGYQLVGWNTSADGSGTEYSLGAQITLPLSETLYAQWSADSGTILFSSNGGTGTVSAVDFVAGESTSLPLGQSLLKVGSTLNGWNTSADGSGTEYALGASVNFTTSETLYAQWSPDEETVSFSANGGENSIPPITAMYGSTISLPKGSTLSRTDYTLVGWNTEPDGKGVDYRLGATVTVTSGETFFATWSHVDFTITFRVPKSKLKIEIVHVASGKTVHLPLIPSSSKPGYSLVGWFTAAKGGHLVGKGGAGYSPLRSITLYAHWTRNHEVTLQFSDNGGTGHIAAQRVPVGTPVIIPVGTSLHRLGFTFRGWASHPLAGAPTERVGQRVILTRTETLYALWRRDLPATTPQVLLGSIGVFAPNSSVISPAMRHAIALIAININRNDRTSILLYGYATSQDNATGSALLSLQRAQVVEKQLRRDLTGLNDAGVIFTTKGEGRLSNSVLSSFRNVEIFAN
jgi:uncharacterized repeat protein (TIGR02543 family)